MTREIKSEKENLLNKVVIIAEKNGFHFTPQEGLKIGEKYVGNFLPVVCAVEEIHEVDKEISQESKKSLSLKLLHFLTIRGLKVKK